MCPWHGCSLRPSASSLVNNRAMTQVLMALVRDSVLLQFWPRRDLPWAHYWGFHSRNEVAETLCLFTSFLFSLGFCLFWLNCNICNLFLFLCISRTWISRFLEVHLSDDTIQENSICNQLLIAIQLTCCLNVRHSSPNSRHRGTYIFSICVCTYLS